MPQTMWEEIEAVKKNELYFMDKEIITTYEFAKRMKDISKGSDPEQNHTNADTLMEETLTRLGYKEGIDIFKTMTKWYG